MRPVGYPERIEGTAGIYERWDPDRHTEAFAALCADAEVMRFLGGRQRREAAEEVSVRIADHWATFGFGLWAAIDRADGRCAGFSGACKPGPAWDPEFSREIEVGWRLGRWAWGRGMATEGARLAFEAGALHLGRREMIAFVDPGNTRSQAVTRRLGMKRRAGAFDGRLGAPVDVYAKQVAVPAVAVAR